MWNRFKSFLKRFFHRRRLIRYGVYLFILLFLFIFRAPVLRGIGNWLIEEDALQKADVIVQLGGSPYERSIKVAELFKKGYAPLVVTTGSNESVPLKAIELHMSEAQLSKEGLMKRGIPDSLIYPLHEGTSTMEEIAALKKMAVQRGYKKMILVTSMFHTGRVHKYFNRGFKGTGIQLIVRGADPIEYKTNAWWQSESGLMMVNNEYVKSVYYWWKY